MTRFIAFAAFVGLSACVVPVPVAAPVPGADVVVQLDTAPNTMSA